MIRNKNLSVDIAKVTAHSGVASNEAADILAKQGTHLAPVDIAIQGNGIFSHAQVTPEAHYKRHQMYSE